MRQVNQVYFLYEYRNMLGHNLERLQLHDLNMLEKDLEIGLSRVNAMKVSHPIHVIMIESCVGMISWYTTLF
jgi:hypothetical protein